MVHFGARWYDSSTGRWLSKDPILLAGGLNLYVFCGNDPVNFSDPLGLAEKYSGFGDPNEPGITDGTGDFLNAILFFFTGGTSTGIKAVATAQIETTAVGLVAKGAIVSGSRAVLKNGFYEVNGLKFSKYYYEKLWATGRGAPSLVANEVLASGAKGVPDAIKAGFLRYEAAGWEMVFNPVTKEVWHLQPIR